MRSLIVTVLICLNLTAFGANEGDKPVEASAKETAPEVVVEPVIREASIMIDGKKVPYKVTTGKLQIKADDGKTRASVFHVSYERTDTKDISTRPVMFAFNGGPGSSAVWLHIGVLGPKILSLPGDGTQPPLPPVRVIDNPLSILDVCDLVFVDPVSTGYSRAGKDVKPDEFHGLDEDIESVGDFVYAFSEKPIEEARPIKWLKTYSNNNSDNISLAILLNHIASEETKSHHKGIKNKLDQLFNRPGGKSTKDRSFEAPMARIRLRKKYKPTRNTDLLHAILNP